MAQSVVSRRAVFEGVLAGVQNGTNVPPIDVTVFDTVVALEDAEDTISSYPYVVAYDIGSVAPTGPSLTAPEADGGLLIQFTSVGRTRAQAQWCSDLVRRVMTQRAPDGDFAVPMGDTDQWVVIDRASYGGAAGVTVEGTPPNEIYSVPDVYVVYVTPM